MNTRKLRVLLELAELESKRAIRDEEHAIDEEMLRIEEAGAAAQRTSRK